MAFTCFNRNIPDEAHEKIKAMGPAGVQAFAFSRPAAGSSSSTAGCSARGIPDECFAKWASTSTPGTDSRHRFPPEGGNRWLIVTDRTYFARNIPDECYDRLGTMWNAGRGTDLRRVSAAGRQPLGDSRRQAALLPRHRRRVLPDAVQLRPGAPAGRPRRVHAVERLGDPGPGFATSPGGSPTSATTRWGRSASRIRSIT